MLGINVFAVLTLFMIITAANYVSRFDKKSQNNILYLFSFLVLSFNIVKLIIDPSQIPVEFSTVSYFIVPLILLLRIRKIEVWAVYASLMAGFFYFTAMILAGGPIYSLYPPINIYTSLFCHGSLLFIGLVKIRTVAYNKNMSFIMIIGNILILSWALYIRDDFTSYGRLFIYELIDATFVEGLVPGYDFLVKIGFYLLLGYSALKSRLLLFKLNEIGLKRHTKKLTAYYNNTIQNNN